MNQLTNLTLFSLLSKSIKNKGYQKKLEEAYVEFINETLHLYQVESDILSIIRTLNLTCIEFIALQSSRLYREGKNAIKIYITKTILFLKLETKLAYSQLNTKDSPQTEHKNYTTLNWKISDNDLIELARALYSANISFNQGKKTTFVNIVKQLEYFFNRKVKRSHNKVSRISERANIAPFLIY